MVSDQPWTQPSVDNSSKVDAKFQSIACVCCSGGRRGQRGGVWNCERERDWRWGKFYPQLIESLLLGCTGGSIILSSSSTLGPNSHLLLSYSYTITMYMLQLLVKCAVLSCLCSCFPLLKGSVLSISFHLLFSLNTTSSWHIWVYRYSVFPADTCITAQAMFYLILLVTNTWIASNSPLTHMQAHTHNTHKRSNENSCLPPLWKLLCHTKTTRGTMRVI